MSFRKRAVNANVRYLLCMCAIGEFVVDLYQRYNNIPMRLYRVVFYLLGGFFVEHHQR